MAEEHRLSPQQERLWPLLGGPAPPPYGAHVLLELAGDLDAAALAGAFADLTARHELLRTTFTPRPGEPAPPAQRVEEPPGATVQLARHDLAGLAPAARERAIDELWRAALAVPFDLGRAPLLRAALMVVEPRRHLLLASLPALLADAAGLANLVRELAGAYGELAAGGDAPAASGDAAAAGRDAEPCQYVDLAAWHHELLLAGDIGGEGRDYWRRWLATAPAAAPAGAVIDGWTDGDAANSPGGRAGGSAGQAAKFVPAHLPIAVPPAVTAAAAALAARQSVAVDAVLLAAWQALLWRLAGGAAVTVAVGFSGRRFPELQGALGLFAHDLPVTTRLDAALPFRAAVERLAAVCGDHHDWQEYWPGDPFPFCFEALPALPAVPAGGRAGQAGALDWRVRRQQVCRHRFTLALECTGSPPELAVTLRHDAAALPARWAALLGERFATLLTSATSAPDLPLGELELLGPAERAQLTAWNATGADYPEEKLLHRLLTAQRARTPDRVAVAWEGGALSHAELGRRAGRLAGRLRSLGVGPEIRVAICMQRSPEMMIALLAVLAAGGAWVPLEPGYPRQRMAAILADAAPRVLLTGPGTPSLLAGPGAPAGVEPVALAGSPMRRLRLDPAGTAASDLEGTASAPDAPESGGGGPASPQNLAYVIYTSGSTGTPKGVMVPHAAIANRVLWLQDRFPVGAGDCVLQKTPLSFDASIWEIFLPWLSGARLVLARPDGHQDTAWLAAALARYEVTVLQLVPSLLAALLEEPAAAGCRALRRVFCGGEALGGALRDRCLSSLGVAPVNTYGPTECAIDATFWECAPADRHAAVPIGRPIANDRIHLLDREPRPVPLGVAGELCVAGVGVARGYLGRPDLTAARFVPDPAGGEPGGRLYRTGDLARQDAGGVLHYLGRIDDQVKLRGLRVELGEIEARLALHPAVREAAVAAPRIRPDGEPGDRRLIACYVPRPAADGSPGAAPDDAELRAWMAAALPEAMVPALFIARPALPRLPGGKLDRRAIAELAPRGAAAGFTAPRTPTEELLAARLAGLLGVERVGAHDSLFALGWNSLLATQVASRLHRLVGVRLPLDSLFEQPTLASLAARVDATLRGSPAAEPPPLVPFAGARERPRPLSFAQLRLWFVDRWQPGSPFYNIPLALRFAGPLDVRVLARALGEIVRRHESLRTRFGEVDGEPAPLAGAPGEPAAFLLPADAAAFPLPVIDLSGLPGERREDESRRLLAAAAALPFDLGTGPLLRALLLRLDGEPRPGRAAGDDRAAGDSRNAGDDRAAGDDLTAGDGRAAGGSHLGLLTLHHIVSDGWSTGVLTAELGTLYAAFAAGRRSPLAELPIQYADFAEWQRGWLHGAALDAHLDYWRRQLAGAPPLLPLRSDRPRPPVQSFRGAIRGRNLAPATVAAARQLARQEAVTLFMMMLAAGQLLLGWYSGQDDIVVGTDVAGRNQPETEGLIGFFINQLVLRTRLDGAPSFRGLLARVREVTVGAYAHQDLPFDKLIEALNPPRGRAHAPLFQVKINLLDQPPPLPELPGLTLTPVGVPRETAQFDWILNLYATGAGVAAMVEYSTDLFEPATIDRMLGGFEALLRAAAERPEARLGELGAVLAAAEEEQRQAELAERRQARRELLQRARRQPFAGDARPAGQAQAAGDAAERTPA
jgi:amino acid adenylation domain-containing protein